MCYITCIDDLFVCISGCLIIIKLYERCCARATLSNHDALLHDRNISYSVLHRYWVSFFAILPIKKWSITTCIAFTAGLHDQNIIFTTDVDPSIRTSLRIPFEEIIRRNIAVGKIARPGGKGRAVAMDHEMMHTRGWIHKFPVAVRLHHSGWYQLVPVLTSRIGVGVGKCIYFGGTDRIADVDTMVMIKIAHGFWRSRTTVSAILF